MADPIVYIDDEPALCRVMELVLGQAGLAVRAFTDPVAALAYLAREPAAVVLCDQRMPQMTGLELLAALPREIPFVLVTGDHSFRSEAEGNPRVRAIIEKPFKFAELLAVLRPFLPPGVTP